MKMRNVHLCGGAAEYARSTRTLEPGDRVLICGDHPWTGHTGEFVAAEILHVINKPGLRIRLDNGMECFVMEPRHLQRL
jgi:hypothetical protein